MRLTKKADKDGSGRLSLNEFITSMQDPRFRYFFEVRGLDIKDAEMFFHMLTSVSGADEVDISTFVSGCLGMRGLASSVDLHALGFEVKVMNIAQQELLTSCVSEIRAGLASL